MSLTLLDQGKTDVLESTRSLYNAGKVVLYCSALTISGSLIASDFTSVPPPVSFTVSPSDSPGFTTPTLSGSEALMDGATITWTFPTVGSPFSIYGYAVLDPTSSKAYFAEARAGGPASISNDGDTFTATLHYRRNAC